MARFLLRLLEDWSDGALRFAGDFRRLAVTETFRDFANRLRIFFFLLDILQGSIENEFEKVLG